MRIYTLPVKLSDPTSQQFERFESLTDEVYFHLTMRDLPFVMYEATPALGSCFWEAAAQLFNLGQFKGETGRFQSQTNAEQIKHAMLM